MRRGNRRGMQVHLCYANGALALERQVAEPQIISYEFAASGKAPQSGCRINIAYLPTLTKEDFHSYNSISSMDLRIRILKW
jgi:hypothetical protein